MMWFKMATTHDNPNYKFRFMKEEVRDDIKQEMATYRKAMNDALRSYPHKATGMFHMRRDHREFKKKHLETGSNDSGRHSYPSMDANVTNRQGLSCAALLATSSSVAPAQEATDLPPDDACAAVPADTAPGAEMPDQPSIDSDLDAEFVEPAKDRERRLEWIRFYVRENDLQKAFDLGWDGKPFKLASSLSAEPDLEDPPEDAGPSQAQGEGALHRI